MMHLGKSKHVLLNITFVLILASLTIIAFLHLDTNNLKKLICDYNVINFINIQKTPDEIARNSEKIIIQNLEQSVINKNKINSH